MIRRMLILGAVMVASMIGLFAVSTAETEGAYFRRYRQRYASWSYYPQRRYYYRYYYYKPYTSYSGYKYHYCVYYPKRPRYVYYYNPYKKVYWGRYDLEAKGYSELDEKDRKANLEDIPEEAFPEPGKMPEVPESEDGVQIEKPSLDDLPQTEAPKDAPGSNE